MSLRDLKPFEHSFDLANVFIVIKMIFDKKKLIKFDQDAFNDLDNSFDLFQETINKNDGIDFVE